MMGADVYAKLVYGVNLVLPADRDGEWDDEKEVYVPSFLYPWETIDENGDIESRFDAWFLYTHLGYQDVHPDVDGALFNTDREKWRENIQAATAYKKSLPVMLTIETTGSEYGEGEVLAVQGLGYAVEWNETKLITPALLHIPTTISDCVVGFCERYEIAMADKEPGWILAARYV